MNTEWNERRGGLTLTLRDTVTLATVIGWAQQSKRVRWLTESHDIATGTVRAIGDDRGAFLRADEDVRTAYVRITTSTGFEWFPTIHEVCRLVDRGEMAEDD